MEKKRYYDTQKPDARVVMIQTFEVVFLCFYLGRVYELMLVFGGILLLLIYHKMYYKAFCHVCLYVCLSAVYFLVRRYAGLIIGDLYSMIFLLYIKLLPIYLTSSILTKKIPMNQLITSMQKMNIPFELIIPIAIVYRYIPTIRDELRHIADSMKMRGKRISIPYFFRHPIESVECCMIPLLIRSGKISDELSAASICKGLDSETVRTSVVNVRLIVSDYIYITISSVIMLVMVFIHITNILNF